MNDLYNRFKDLTGYNGQTLAILNNVSRQYVSNMAKSENESSQRALGEMMLTAIHERIDEKEYEIKKLKKLFDEVNDEMYPHRKKIGGAS